MLPLCPSWQRSLAVSQEGDQEAGGQRQRRDFSSVLLYQLYVLLYTTISSSKSKEIAPMLTPHSMFSTDSFVFYCSENTEPSNDFPQIPIISPMPKKVPEIESSTFWMDAKCQAGLQPPRGSILSLSWKASWGGTTWCPDYTMSICMAGLRHPPPNPKPSHQHPNHP